MEGALQFHNQINTLYYHSGCCLGVDDLDKITAQDLSDVDYNIIDTERLLNKALNNIYRKRGGTGYIEPNLFELNNKPLQNGIDKTFKKAGVEFGKRNEVFIDQFKHNTSVFAAFKTHKEQNELAKLMLNEKGDLRPWHEFRKEAETVIGSYNQTWLLTEYDTAVRAARMATNWKKFEERQHIYPNVEYMLSRSERKRLKHKEWVGTILPIDHPWWDKHAPPSAWGCKCWVRQTRAKVTEVPDDGNDPTPLLFQNNPGKSGEFIVIDEHPYVKEATISKQDVQDFLSKRTDIKPEYIRQQGIGSDKGYLDIHTFADQTPTNKTIGERLADTGHKVRLLPDIQPTEKELRKLLLPDGIKPNKNPDAMIGGRIFEFKTLESNTYNAVSQELRKAGNQADYILLNIDGSMDDTVLNRAIRGRVKNKSNIQEVWVMKDGYIRKYDREHILGDQFGKKSKAL